MSGRKPFRELTQEWSEERRLGMEERVTALLQEVQETELSELRKALKISQNELATVLGKSQGAVAQLEQRTDMKISTLRETIEALGGRLELVANFPSGKITLSNLGQSAE